MHKEEDKLSLNMDEDFTLPNLDEGTEIGDIPTIEDLISLDKDEIEKIQTTEIANVFNDDEKSNSDIFDNNIDNESAQEGEISPEFNSFDTNFGEMNLFDEDVALTLDEPAFNADNIENNSSDTEINSFNDDHDFEDQSKYEYNISDEKFSVNDSFENESPSAVDEEFSFDENIQNITLDNEISIQDENEADENSTLDENIESETSSFDDEFETNEADETTIENENIDSINSDEFDNKDYEMNNIEENSSIETENQTKEDYLSDEIDSLDKVEKVVNEQNDSENITEENINLINEENTTTELNESSSNFTEKTSAHSNTDDVFAKIDSLLNDDSAFETSANTSSFESKIMDNNVNIEMPKPTFKSSFNPAKYINKDSLQSLTDKEDKLGILYAAKKVIDNIKTLGEELNSNENSVSIVDMLKSDNSKKALLTAAVCVVVLGAGITSVSIFNNKSVEEIDSISKNDVKTPLEVENVTQPATTPTENRQEQAPSLIDENANVSSDAPDLGQIQQPKVETKQEIIQEEVKKQTKPTNTESYLTVKKIQWQVPDYLSYSPNIKSYLQSAGNSINLSLSSDLLLATEYAYSNVVKINLKMSNSGTVQNASVASSSGSKEIDNIVLQSVKSTLNVVKPPANEVKTPDFNLTITIYL